MKKNRQKFSNSSKIAKEMCLRLTLIVVLPVLIVGLFLVIYSYNTLYTQSASQIESDNLRVKSILTDCFINISNLSDEILEDRSLQEYLMEQGDSQSTSLFPEASYSRIESILAKNTSISSLHIYTTNPYVKEGTYITAATQDVLDECFIKAEVPASAVWGIYTSVNRNKDNPELALIRSFPLKDSRYPAIVVITVSSNYLRNRIQNNSLSTMLTINDSNIFFSTIRSLQETPMPVEIDYSTKYYSAQGLFDYEGKKVLGYISSLPVYNTSDTLYIYTMDLNARSRMLTIGFTNAAITIGVIVVALLGIIIYASYLSKRIIALRASMKGAKDGNYDDIIDSLKGDDELTETFEDLKALIEDIKKKDAMMYEAQIKEQEFINEQSKMKYKLLSNQINPHFIYNTLETIRMLALEADAAQVADATLLLAKSMRYVLDNTMVNSTTLDKELEYVDVYLQIQQIRFEERLEYAINVDSAINPSECPILPMLLQPIVENAVIHGLESITQKVHIDIVIALQDKNTMLITITDNGKGITPDRLRELTDKLTQKTGGTKTSIGLSNIRNRIKLFYGEEYGMHITSAPGMGTSVTINLPINTSIKSS
ncbi:MAG: sensor histidine kinase [Lachnospiraceae bacterium]